MAFPYENTVRPVFDRKSETYEVYHDSDNHWSVSTTLVLALSSITGDEPTEMHPLNRVVDPDVLESHVHDTVRNRDARLSFDFHGYHVTARHDGQINLTPLGEQEAQPHGS